MPVPICSVLPAPSQGSPGPQPQVGLTDTSILGGQETGLEIHVQACMLHEKREGANKQIQTEEGKNESEGDERNCKTGI